MNTNLNEMQYRCPKAVNLGRCTLENYELKFRLHADIDRSEGHTMEGVLWEITTECERALDSLEGYPYYYDKIEIVVNPDTLFNKMTHIVAMAYVMTKKGQEEAPSLHYKDCLLEGYKTNGLDVDKLTSKIEELIMNQLGYV